MKIGWIGVGRMGAPMAARLLRAGYDVSIWNRTRAKAETEELKGAKIASRSERSTYSAPRSKSAIVSGATRNVSK